MVIHTRNLCSAFNPSKHTHSSEHTPGAVGSHISAAPGEQLGVWCLAQGSHLSRGIEGGESAEYSLPPLTIPAGPEARTRPTGYKSDSLSIRRDCPKKVYKSIQLNTLIKYKITFVRSFLNMQSHSSTT